MDDQHQDDEPQKPPIDEPNPPAADEPAPAPSLPEAQAEPLGDHAEISADDLPPEGMEQPMEIHKPKPVHNWREFISEIGVVFIGIILALGAEALVEDYHWEQQAKTSREAIKTELAAVAGYSYERVIVQPCMAGQLHRLADQLRSGSPAWKGMPMPLDYSGAPYGKLFPVGAFGGVMPAAYLPTSRPMSEDAWRTAMASGVLAHMDPEEVAKLTKIYASVETWIKLQDSEAEAASRLTSLAFDGPMDARRRSDMISAVAEVDRKDSLIALVSQQLIDRIRELHLGYTQGYLSPYIDELVQSSQKFRGSCVRNDVKADFG